MKTIEDFKKSASRIRSHVAAVNLSDEILAVAKEFAFDYDFESAVELEKLSGAVLEKDYTKYEKKSAEVKEEEVEEVKEEEVEEVKEEEVEEVKEEEVEEVKGVEQPAKAVKESVKGKTFKGIKGIRYAATFLDLGPIDSKKEYTESEITNLLTKAGYFEFDKKGEYILAKDGTLLLTIKGSTKGNVRTNSR